MAINQWKLLHTYNALAEQNVASPLVCPDCNNGVVPIIDAKSDEPVPALYCLTCDAVSRPGLDFWDQIKAVVLRFYPLSQLA